MFYKIENGDEYRIGEGLNRNHIIGQYNCFTSIHPVSLHTDVVLDIGILHGNITVKKYPCRINPTIKSKIVFS